MDICGCASSEHMSVSVCLCVKMNTDRYERRCRGDSSSISLCVRIESHTLYLCVLKIDLVYLHSVAYVVV